MPRQARIDAPGAVHHIITRGIERSAIFASDEDYEDFLRRLEHLLLETGTKCFAWALIPNHFHLLLQTGNVPIATVMRRLLTGYATSFNRRHERSGHLFQNRYKSILCQEDIYLKELVRYIHLNPLRARLVENLNGLSEYAYAGHGTLLGKRTNKWQCTDTVLFLFGAKVLQARKNYEEYVTAGVELEKQDHLTGGGLIRSAGGWKGVLQLRKSGSFQKSDERILGDGEFVETVLAEAEESMSRRHRYKAKGVGFDHLLEAVALLVGLEPEEVIGASKSRANVKARALLCYLAVREMGLPATEVSMRLKISLPTVSVAAQKGRQLVRDKGLDLENILNLTI